MINQLHQQQAAPPLAARTTPATLAPDLHAGGPSAADARAADTGAVVALAPGSAAAQAPELDPVQSEQLGLKLAGLVCMLSTTATNTLDNTQAQHQAREDSSLSQILIRLTLTAQGLDFFGACAALQELATHIEELQAIYQRVPRFGQLLIACLSVICQEVRKGMDEERARYMELRLFRCHQIWSLSKAEILQTIAPVVPLHDGKNEESTEPAPAQVAPRPGRDDVLPAAVGQEEEPAKATNASSHPTANHAPPLTVNHNRLESDEPAAAVAKDGHALVKSDQQQEDEDKNGNNEKQNVTTTSSEQVITDASVGDSDETVNTTGVDTKQCQVGRGVDTSIDAITAPAGGSNNGDVEEDAARRTTSSTLDLPALPRQEDEEDGSSTTIGSKNAEQATDSLAAAPTTFQEKRKIRISTDLLKPSKRVEVMAKRIHTDGLNLSILRILEGLIFTMEPDPLLISNLTQRLLKLNILPHFAVRRCHSMLNCFRDPLLSVQYSEYYWETVLRRARARRQRRLQRNAAKGSRRDDMRVEDDGESGAGHTPVKKEHEDEHRAAATDEDDRSYSLVASQQLSEHTEEHDETGDEESEAEPQPRDRGRAEHDADGKVLIDLTAGTVALENKSSSRREKMRKTSSTQQAKSNTALEVDVDNDNVDEEEVRQSMNPCPCLSILQRLRPKPRAKQVQEHVLRTLREKVLKSDEFRKCFYSHEFRDGLEPSLLFSKNKRAATSKLGSSGDDLHDGASSTSKEPEMVPILPTVELYGSSVNGFMTGDSDIDVTLLHPALSHASLDPSLLREKCILLARCCKQILPSEGFANVTVIHARIPLVKVKDYLFDDLKFNIDISFNNVLGYQNSKLLRAYANCPLCQDLGMLVKAWAKRRELIDAQNGLLSSYAYMLLVIFFLQHKKKILPNLQKSVKNSVRPRENFLYGCHDITFDKNWEYDASLAQRHLDSIFLPNACAGNARTNRNLFPPATATCSFSTSKEEFLQNEGTTAASSIPIDPSCCIPSPLYCLFTQFFHYYAHEYNFHREVVSIRLGQPLPKLKYLHYFRSETELAHQQQQMARNGGDQHNKKSSYQPPRWSCPLIQTDGGNTVRFAQRHVNLLIEDPFEKGQIKCPTYLGQERLCYEFQRAYAVLSETIIDQDPLLTLFAANSYEECCAPPTRIMPRLIQHQRPQPHQEQPQQPSTLQRGRLVESPQQQQKSLLLLQRAATTGGGPQGGCSTYPYASSTTTSTSKPGGCGGEAELVGKSAAAAPELLGRTRTSPTPAEERRNELLAKLIQQQQAQHESRRAGAGETETTETRTATSRPPGGRESAPVRSPVTPTCTSAAEEQAGSSSTPPSTDEFLQPSTRTLGLVASADNKNSLIVATSVSDEAGVRHVADCKAENNPVQDDALMKQARAAAPASTPAPKANHDLQLQDDEIKKEQKIDAETIDDVGLTGQAELYTNNVDEELPKQRATLAARSAGTENASPLASVCAPSFSTSAPLLTASPGAALLQTPGAGLEATVVGDEPSCTAGTQAAFDEHPAVMNSCSVASTTHVAAGKIKKPVGVAELDSDEEEELDEFDNPHHAALCDDDGAENAGDSPLFNPEDVVPSWSRSPNFRQQDTFGFAPTTSCDEDEPEERLEDAEAPQGSYGDDFQNRPPEREEVDAAVDSDQNDQKFLTVGGADPDFHHIGLEGGRIEVAGELHDRNTSGHEENTEQSDSMACTTSVLFGEAGDHLDVCEDEKDPLVRTTATQQVQVVPLEQDEGGHEEDAQQEEVLGTNNPSAERVVVALGEGADQEKHDSEEKTDAAAMMKTIPNSSSSAPAEGEAAYHEVVADEVEDHLAVPEEQDENLEKEPSQ
ncbi:unnamed protein product [Amoebophrya sp. A120]|nr:unnamed protein product [Amoebophrya sp. A120]|eukprot:GSA120T00026112001.1